VRVKEIMTTSLITVTTETTILEAMALMTRHQIRHLPVLNQALSMGLSPMADLVSEVVTGQAFAIDQLQKYISQA